MSGHDNMSVMVEKNVTASQDEEMNTITDISSIKSAAVIMGGHVAEGVSEDVSEGVTGFVSEGVSYHGVSIDSRTVGAGEMFFAIRGEKADGHNFIKSSFERGAVVAVVDSRYAEENEIKSSEDACFIVVADTHQALIDLASERRRQSSTRYVGITGSVGKTTIKEMVAYLLKRAGRETFSSPGNLNNLYGLPLSLLGQPGAAQFGVFELGVSTVGEMSRLAPILEPEVAVIANVRAVHLEEFGDLDNVRSEKTKLLDHIQANGTAVIDAEDSQLMNMVTDRGLTTLSFSGKVAPESGASPTDFRPTALALNSETGAAVFQWDGAEIALQVFGLHQAGNALCALAVCRALDVAVDPRWLNDFTLESVSMRGEILQVGSVTVIVDCYNASPASMSAGLETFASYTLSAGAAKIAVLGDMLELGSASLAEHENVGRKFAETLLELKAQSPADGSAMKMAIKTTMKTNMKAVLTVGSEACRLGESFQSVMSEHQDTSPVLIENFPDSGKAGERLAELAEAGDVIYLKGSRGVALERVLESLEFLEERE